ncbi:MAG TPA: helix-turn-helix domain-containing protein [Novosphingobium sp.]|nr:helix-turn-helix domain-containing protein [Novosphingobium sp.]
MRRDAQQRRQALLAAAVDCFQKRGYAVPLEEIADRAGVGRGTLYRNFKDRAALALAIFEREVEDLAAGTDYELPLGDTLKSLAFRGAQATALFNRIAAEMQLTEEDRAGFRALGQRVEAMLEPIARRGHEKGTLRPEVGARELAIAMRMMSALITKYRDKAEAEEHVAIAVGLLLKGLSPA